ncbi:MAG: 30S ribosomal protein S16 [Patescibacteria group bacterium]
MLTIRLTRVGKKKDSSFRVIIIDSKRKVKAGNYLEMLGSYDPRVNKAELKADRIQHWLKEGAKPSDTVHNLLISQKIIEGKKINVLPRKSPPPISPEATKAEEKEREIQPAPAAEPEAKPEESSEASVTNEVAEEAPADKIEE